MNLSVYLTEKIINRISTIAQKQNISKNAIVKEAIEEWLDHHHTCTGWPENFFDFKEVKEAPDFSSYRSELSSPKEPIF